MDRDDGFEPRVGRIGRNGRAVSLGREFRNQVIKTRNLARGGKAVGSKPSSFTGARLGRGSGAGTVLASRSGTAGVRGRRVMVKARIVKLAGKGKGAAVAHMRYVQRDGVTRSGERGELYDGLSDVADGKAFLERSDGDRHQFRFIVSPEDGLQYDDLKSVTRRLMDQMETDLGTKLDWVAVDHFNTGHPHTHILIRGRDDQDKDLVIARSYITDGVRERASDIVSFDLGPRTELEVEQSLQHEMRAGRFTSLDQWILDRRQDDGRVSVIDASPERQSLITGRLKRLESFDLAAPDGQGYWQVSKDLEPALRQLGRRGDIINSLRYDLSPDGQGQLLENVRIHDGGALGTNNHGTSSLTQPITGRLVRRGLYDEIEDRHYLIIDATDGQAHVVDIGKGENTPDLTPNSVLRLAPKTVELRSVDHTIADVAAATGGRYSVELHLNHDRNAQQTFAETHVRRLEAIRRYGSGIERDRYNGEFIVGHNYRETALAYERQKAAQTPIRVEVLSPEPLKVLERKGAYTWLDKELTSPDKMPLSDKGFGAQVTQALRNRYNWMIEEGLFQSNDDGTFSYDRNLEKQLTAREKVTEGQRLSQELGKPMGHIHKYENFEGKLTGSVTLSNGDKFAVVERARDFALVPWRPVLERHIGKAVGGISRGDDVSWSFGRDRGLSR
ncbi:DUF3363 domain-containing protein [Asticcacaulis sp. ZE23SCel15]|uniref:DUF3363 domain-containing protein n=1 Tax=Asticcacaulis sp. ZE23SCel15 TaxID=3059027 RepID=UPI00265E2973|nr:DUF3363 domain-containing protein [Asticcacaulis sp. ZE23SCel15]WKL58005.1 DUF3363 domain-containing protein [Asticcacaulis sp. ZE23SCel15]